MIDETRSALRDAIRSLYDRLIFVPVVFVIAGIIAGFGVVRLDRWTSDDWLPAPLRSTVDSADSVLSTIAGGLIAAITLLLSITLVAVQLASSQFSPRTINDWIRDTTQQVTIGLVLGTTVFCLMVLRETQSLKDSISVSPDISVLVAVALMIICLVAVVQSVGHLSNRMRIGTVARTLMEDTVASVRRSDDAGTTHLPARPKHGITDEAKRRHGDGWTAAVATEAGWLQLVAWHELAKLAADGSQIDMAMAVGEFALEGAPVAWIEQPVRPDDGSDIELSRDVASIDQTRRVEADPGYGILQMTDVALRALSPGINDPNTACDIVAYMGVVLLAIWEQPAPDTDFDVDGRHVRTRETTHEQYLDAALAQIIRYGAADVVVMRAILDTLDSLRREIVRRDLPGPIEPIIEMEEWVADAVEQRDHLATDRRHLTTLARDAANARISDG